MTNLILKGYCKNIKLGSKGNRYKIIIDDIELSDDIRKKIDESITDNKVNGKPILNISDFVRNKKIEVRL